MMVFNFGVRDYHKVKNRWPRCYGLFVAGIALVLGAGQVFNVTVAEKIIIYL
jgi:hypothetical protein